MGVGAAHRVDWHTRNTPYGRIIIIIITISYIQDKPSCPKPTAKSKSPVASLWVEGGAACLPAPPDLTHTSSLRKSRPLFLLIAEAWHMVGRLALPTPPLRVGHTCTGG